MLRLDGRDLDHRAAEVALQQAQAAFVVERVLDGTQDVAVQATPEQTEG